VREVVVVVSVVAVQPATKSATRPRNISAIRFLFIVQRKRRRSAKWTCVIGCERNPAAAAATHVSFNMKQFYFALLAASSLGLAGCATEATTATTQTQTDQTTTRVHTQEELRKSGESQTGPALQKTDAAITTSGPR
jgi:hypothetical protein